MNRNAKMTKLIVLLAVLFLAIAGTGLYLGAGYIEDQLLRSNEAIATDIALLVKNNFEITDAEVTYMKSLTFNEMEVDPINKRLMDVGNGVALNAAISNVYIIAPLSESETRYCPDEETADFLGLDLGTPLNGMWLLNGRINEAGVFEAAQRDDIYRYTALDSNQLLGMERRETFGTFTQDAWGSFITGYAPIYTVEGNFAGLLGIDMDPDRYQSSAQSMIVFMIVFFAVIVLAMVGLFIPFYIKYTKARAGQLQFEFYSRMSHDLRTPMNGILGMAELSKTETDANVLRHNFEIVADSGAFMLKLINETLNYQPEADRKTADNIEVQSKKDEKISAAALDGKRLLLCEDHKLNAEITRRLLAKVGCAVEIAENGKLGLDMFAASKKGYYDAILMDIRMPVLDGLAAAELIRALDRPDAKIIPIIALTANTYDEDIQNTKRAGMNAHLAKPIDPNALYNTLAKAMSSGT